VVDPSLPKGAHNPRFPIAIVQISGCATATDILTAEHLGTGSKPWQGAAVPGCSSDWYSTWRQGHSWHVSHWLVFISRLLK